LTIGRANGSHVLIDDAQVSRTHAVIEVDETGSALVRDAGSINGVLVDGRKIDGSTRLRIGQRVQVGGHWLLVTRATRDDIVTRRGRPRTETTDGSGHDVKSKASSTEHGASIAEALVASCENQIGLREWSRAQTTAGDAAGAIERATARKCPVPHELVARLSRCFIEIACALRSFDPLERALGVHIATLTVLDLEGWAQAASIVGGIPAGSEPLRQYLGCMRAQPMTFSQRLRLRRLEHLTSASEPRS
jgi:hypothetical protein